MNIYYFLASLTGLSTIIIWLGKFIITKTVDTGIEKYKAELTKDIEKHKAELSKITLEHQVKFSKLHEQRADKIKLLYNKVKELEKSLQHSTTVFQGPEFSDDTQRDSETLNQIVSLTDLVDAERIYFSESTILRFESLIQKSREILKGMRNVRLSHQQYDSLIKRNKEVPQKILEEMDKWTEVDDKVEDEFKGLKLELANEFRNLLGISTN
ncbi:hypothetical protein [Ferruginibacter sp. SUN106]|uniref:hypothetical protein n=1 Tax=Ferruginibacter sp. SUN106 TaxID=2978348 RepID=UPI003D36F98B